MARTTIAALEKQVVELTARLATVEGHQHKLVRQVSLLRIRAQAKQPEAPSHSVSRHMTPARSAEVEARRAAMAAAKKAAMAGKKAVRAEF